MYRNPKKEIGLREGYDIHYSRIHRQVELAVSPVIIDEQVNLKTLSYMHTDNFTSCCMPVLPLRFACEAGV